MDCIATPCRKHVVERFYLSVGRIAGGKGVWTALLAVFPLLLCLILSIGVSNMQWESRASHLWTPITLKERMNFDFIEQEFPVVLREEIVFGVGSNVLTRTSLLEMLEAQDVILSTKTNGKGFDDFCVKLFSPRSAAPCELSTVLGFWEYNATLLRNDPDPVATLVNAEELGLISLESTFGGLKRNASGYPELARAVVIVVNVEDGIEGVLEWELDVHDALNKLNKKVGVKLEWFMGRSFDDEVGNAVNVDMPLFGAAVVVLLTFLAFTLGKPCSCVYGRHLLGYSAIITIILSLSAALGTMSWMGIPFNSINFLASFILAGIAADNLILIVDIFDREEEKDDLSTRMGNALSHAGTSATITSISTVVAFAAGATSSLPGVVSFSVLAAFAFFFNLLLQLTFFPVLLALDQRRMDASRSSICPCFVIKKSTSVGVEYEAKSKDGEEESKNDGEESKMSLAERIAHVEGTFVTQPLASIPIILIYLILAGLGASSLPLIHVGLDANDVVVDDSFVADALNVQTKFYGAVPSDLELVLLDFPLEKQSARQNLANLVTDMLEIESIYPPIVTWVAEVEAFASKFNITFPSTKSDAVQLLQDMLHNATTCPLCQCDCRTYQARVVVEGGKVEHGKTTVRAAVPDSPKALDLRDELEDLLPSNDISSSSAFFYTDQFLFKATDKQMPSLLLEAMLTAASAVVILLLLLLHAELAFLIGACIIALDCILLGYMYVTQSSINAVSLVTILLGIGLAVDESAHIGGHYLLVSGEGERGVRCTCWKWTFAPKWQRDRSIESVTSMGSSVAKGAFTTLLGTIFLAGASSQAFRDFFILVLGIILLGGITGLVFLPSLLSWVGVCTPQASAKDEND